MSASFHGRPTAIALLLAAVSALMCAGSPPALAGSAPFPLALSVTGATVSGSPLIAIALRSARGAGCQLEVRAASTHTELPRRRIGASGAASWRWRPGALRADLAWRFTATCRIGGLWSQRWLAVEPGFAGPAALAPSTAVQAAAPGASCDSQGLCFAGDDFPAGQCTWYAAGRRPDLAGIVSGDAGSWLAEAQGHVPEGWYPVVGAVAVWLPFHDGADGDGHVAYVAAVSPSGRILVDDSNWHLTPDSPGLEVHEHWVSALAPSGYIYGGPAGAGPNS